SVLGLPILFVLENNHYAMSTPTEVASARPLADRARALGLATSSVEALDALELWELSGKLIGEIRADRRPRFLEVRTFRFSGHSKNDKREYIPAEEEARWAALDPLAKLGSSIDTADRERAEARARETVAIAIAKTRQE
ncbi:MAG: thiamine pyrophosphate-dependent enzyme, partial [Spirochaetaceae bacterium]|nr:thiamine pyrophosphate-dependent enzyme [Spirochaetaceae bacterium]